MCVLPGEERVRELFGGKVDLNGHSHYYIDVEECDGIAGIEGICMTALIRMIISF